MAFPFLQPSRKGLDGIGLISRGLERGVEVKDGIHSALSLLQQPRRKRKGRSRGSTASIPPTRGGCGEVAREGPILRELLNLLPPQDRENAGLAVA